MEVSWLLNSGRWHHLLSKKAVVCEELSQRQVLRLQEQRRSGAHALQGIRYLCLKLFPFIIITFQMIIATMQRASAPARSRKEASDTEDDATDDEVKIIEPAVGWAYVGSHNFTPSAWGTLSGSAFNPILNVSARPLGGSVPEP